MINGIVATVGRPNVDKSAISNRVIDKRKDIVKDTPGVTRDRIYGKAEWLTREFRVIDTGGIQLANRDFQMEINIQVEIVTDEADCIVFVVSGKDGLTHDDEYVIRLLHKAKRPVTLAVNEMGDPAQGDTIYEFYSLGLGDPLAVSDVHGIDIGDVLDAVIRTLPEKEKSEYGGMTKFCIIGRPNVGRNPLVNAILNQERVIVSNIGGAIRDVINTPSKWEGKEYVAIDAAGTRKHGKVYENIEKYSVLRATSATERSDIVLVVTDEEKGIRDQDRHVTGYAHKAGKGVVIVYNKWNTVEKNEQTMYTTEKEIRAQFLYLSYASVLFISTLKKQRIHTILPIIGEVHDYSVLRIQTSVLSEIIADAQLMIPPPTYKGQHLKIYHTSQVSVAPPIFMLFVSDLELLHSSYKQYLENRLREAFGFTGTTLRILVKKRNR